MEEMEEGGWGREREERKERVRKKGEKGEGEGERKREGIFASIRSIRGSTGTTSSVHLENDQQHQTT
jgi:hypothetical protein